MTEPKIKKFAIDQFWLENHADSNKPTCIQDWGGGGVQRADDKQSQDYDDINGEENARDSDSDNSEGIYAS
jgi:hypothetical protein